MVKRKRSRQIGPETLKALGELVRAAVKHTTGKDPEEPIDITICRGPSWCGVKDGRRAKSQGGVTRAKEVNK